MRERTIGVDTSSGKPRLGLLRETLGLQPLGPPLMSSVASVKEPSCTSGAVLALDRLQLSSLNVMILNHTLFPLYSFKALAGAVLFGVDRASRSLSFSASTGPSLALSWRVELDSSTNGRTISIVGLSSIGDDISRLDWKLLFGRREGLLIGS